MAAAITDGRGPTLATSRGALRLHPAEAWAVERSASRHRVSWGLDAVDDKLSRDALRKLLSLTKRDFGLGLGLRPVGLGKGARRHEPPDMAPPATIAGFRAEGHPSAAEKGLLNWRRQDVLGEMAPGTEDEIQYI